MAEFKLTLRQDRPATIDERRELIDKVDRLTRENEALRKALEKIADYSPASTVQPVAITREALAALKEPGNAQA